nr:tRNA lysidine(34) synthetase TilS [uncultured Prevotella sp.]
MQKFIHRIEDFISRNHLLEKDGKYLVALSGGADSVTLLWVLHELRYQIEACHCNFQLRGAESDRDEQFCVQLCEQLGIPLHRIHFDTRLYAEVHKESIELAARNLRYRYFAQLKEDVEADGICVAHHQDDTVETVLINLIRGAGIQGLTGISAKNGDILRPLLCVDRKEILAYLEEKGQDYVTDSTNLVDDVVRNKIRLNIIPMLKEINPAASKNIAQAARHLEEANKMLSSIAICGEKSEDGTIRVAVQEIESAASAEYALYSSLSPYGFRGKAITDILASLHSTGKTWTSETHQLVIDRDCILIREKQTEAFQGMKIPETGCYVLPRGEKIKLSIREREIDFSPSKEKFLVTLDADAVTFPLHLRLAQNGDTFHPFGMKGKKLVSDYLTDRKKNLFEKQSQLVLEDAKGQIIWVVGERTSELCKIKEDTKKILYIQVSQVREVKDLKGDSEITSR